ncbi:hypothetical protein [Leucobacter insecticola]|nr:hypothetical protein [Leucobacter insecticola]
MQAGVEMVAEATATWDPTEVATLTALMQRFLGNISTETTPSPH